jgi:ParB family chromosome partitioning protein
MKPGSKLSGRFPSADVFFGTSADLPRIVELDLAKVVANPDQPRRTFDTEKLEELAASIAESGLIHPITVRRTERNTYMIVAGERRFRAFGLLGRKSIPAIISEGGMDELALIENIQREDLSPIDEYRAVARLIEKHGYSQADAAKVLGKSRVSINELLGLRALAPAIVEDRRVQRTPKSTLIEIARAGDDAAQLKLWAAMEDRPTTVRAVRSARNGGAVRNEMSLLVAALRAGRLFSNALRCLPEQAKSNWKEIASLSVRLLELLDQAHEASESERKSGKRLP